MFENISILVQSVKGTGKCAHFPAVALMLLRGRMFRVLYGCPWYALFYLILINKLPSLSLPLGNAKGSPAEGELQFTIVECIV